ncbi:MAG TPA: YezD family protein [Methylomusa anaerophila]|uniref:DUF2292 domain-containing protein n=1 Tax=Methylomusa anaerophila TaxID=1930071 RepID=A0A348AQQ6_9FIRM|nr:YezD family protein [Methylomusa anaerophila]BBB93404.1 hypothetical protein MAMMFC1_04121 [Methylomusa anaerophila]HML90352.1 YezD family protein [Methylomusa anaerophila]
MQREAKVKQVADKTLPSNVLTLIEKAITDINFGSVTLVVQDSRVIQIEKIEKIRVCDMVTYSETNKDWIKSPGNTTDLRMRILSAVRGLEYGKATIQVQAGEITQVEKTEKYRFTKMTGVNGDGI